MKKLLLITGLLLLVTSLVMAQATLKHSYTFEEGTFDATTVFDQVGTLNGTLGGTKISVGNGKATVSGATANSDGWISFDGVALALSTYSRGISLEAYLETGQTLNSSYTMLAYFGTATPGNGCLWIQPTRAANETRIETNNRSTTITALKSGYEVDDGKKHHLVAILSPEALTYYLDGMVLAQTLTNGSDYISTIGTEVANFFRGVDGWNDPNYNASLEEFNIYEGVLDHSTLVGHAGDYLGLELDNVLLDTLYASLGTFDQEFNAEILEYELMVPYGTRSVKLTAIAEANISTVTMYDGNGNEVADGVFTFGEEGDDIEITVDAADGVTSISYYVSIFIDNPALVATLSDIQLSAGNLKTAFDANVTEYVVYVPKGTNSVDVTGIPSWAGATVTGGGTIDLSSGSAMTNLVVTSEDKSSNMVYIIKLIWTDFKLDKEFYIQHELAKCVITGVKSTLITMTPAIKDDSTQLFKILNSGVKDQYYLQNKTGQYLALAKTANVWDITMSAKLTTDKDSSRFYLNEFEPGRYTIHAVKRSAFENDMLGTNYSRSNEGIYSDKYPGNVLTTWNLLPADNVFYPSDNTLSDLSIDVIALHPHFEPLRFNYDITLPLGTTALNIGATATDATASVSGAGAIDVSNGEGTISVTVTAADNQSSKTYKINYRVDSPATLVHSYTFADGTAQDQVGDADGVVNKGSIVNGAFQSTVDGDYIILPSEEIAINTYSSITIEAYVEAGVNPGWTMLAYFGDNSGGSNTFWLSIARNDDVTRIEANTHSSQNYTTGIEPAAGEKHHIVGKLTNDTIYLYMDGALSTKTATNADFHISQIATSTAWLGFGAYNDPTWKGILYEFNIYEGLMDDATIAARAHNFPSEDETGNATLSDLMVNGTTIANFSSFKMRYDLVLPAGTTTAPKITATPKNSKSTVVVTDATAVPGVAIVTVTAEDGITKNTYTVNLMHPVSKDATLSDIKVDGVSISGFASGTHTYEINLPTGTTNVPVITATASDANATFELFEASSLNESTAIVVTAPDGKTSITYVVHFKVSNSSNNMADYSSVFVYPTISNSDFVLRTNNKVCAVSVFNVSGRKIYQCITRQNEEVIRVPENGIYLIKVGFEGTVKTFKVIKTN